MNMDSLIVFVIVLIAVVYLAYFLFRKKGCSCGNESGGSACCGGHTDENDECCGNSNKN